MHYDERKLFTQGYRQALEDVAALLTSRKGFLGWRDDYVFSDGSTDEWNDWADLVDALHKREEKLEV